MDPNSCMNDFVQIVFLFILLGENFFIKEIDCLLYLFRID